MWAVNEATNEITMARGDWGIIVPITLDDVTITASDSARLTIKSTLNGTTIIEKEFTNIVNNTIQVMLTESESAKLKVGKYVYSLDWYQNGSFMCNIIPTGSLSVVNKV